MLELSLDPFPHLFTERLCLREINVADAEALHELRSHPEVLKYLDRPAMASLSATVSFIESCLKQQYENKSVLWAIAKKETPSILIGTIGYWRLIPEHYRAELGYMLLPMEWGKGFMKEAVNAVIDYAFNNTTMHSIEANINPGNIASARLLESCGFVQEAFFKENYYHDGRFLDSMIYSLIKKG